MKEFCGQISFFFGQNLLQITLKWCVFFLWASSIFWKIALKKLLISHSGFFEIISKKDEFISKNHIKICKQKLEITGSSKLFAHAIFSVHPSIFQNGSFNGKKHNLCCKKNVGWIKEESQLFPNRQQLENKPTNRDVWVKTALILCWE